MHGCEPRLDLVGAQAPEPVLDRAHVDAHIVFHAFRESTQPWQLGRCCSVDAECAVEPFDLRPAIGARRGDLFAGVRADCMASNSSSSARVAAESAAAGGANCSAKSVGRFGEIVSDGVRCCHQWMAATATQRARQSPR